MANFTPIYRIKLNQAGQAVYGNTWIDVQMRWGMTPAGHSFQMWHRTIEGGALSMLTSYGDWLGPAVLPIIDEMNKIGMIAFIEKYVVPWFTKMIYNLFGTYAASNPSAPFGNTVITLQNIDSIANGTLGMFNLVDDGTGLPKMVKV